MRIPAVPLAPRLSRACPLCPQYECSCCDSSDMVHVYRGLTGAAEDPAFPRLCLELTTQMLCRPCDPEVIEPRLPATTAPCAPGDAACSTFTGRSSASQQRSAAPP